MGTKRSIIQRSLPIWNIRRVLRVSMYFSSNFHNCNYNRRLDSFVCLFVFFSLFQDIVRSLAQGKKKIRNIVKAFNLLTSSVHAYQSLARIPQDVMIVTFPCSRLWAGTTKITLWPGCCWCWCCCWLFIDLTLMSLFVGSAEGILCCRCSFELFFV